MLSKLVDFLKDKPFVLSAGIMRSGSTMIYNVLRQILLIKYGDGLAAGWQNDMANPPVGDFYLIKTHNIAPFFEANPEHIFFTYRDLRVVEVSMNKFFGTPLSAEAIGYYILEYYRARENGATTIKYEELIKNPKSYILAIANSLKINVNVDAICDKVLNLKPPIDGVEYSKETLLHPEHITGTKDDEWRKLMPDEMQNKIRQDYAWWFEKCGYPVE